MVRAPHRRSEGYRFDSRQGLKKIFWENSLRACVLRKSVVYKAKITIADNQEKKVYIGITANAFKERYRNHMKSLKNQKYANVTELSKFVWKQKTANCNITTKWSILKQIPSLKIGSTRCNLCLEEKLIIMKGRKKNLLNSRSELLTKYRHVTKHHFTLHCNV